MGIYGWEVGSLWRISLDLIDDILAFVIFDGLLGYAELTATKFSNKVKLDENWTLNFSKKSKIQPITQSLGQESTSVIFDIR